MIKFEDFQKIDLRIAKIINAERVKDSKNLLRLELDAGDSLRRQIVAGIAQFYKAEDLMGKEIVIVANLEPKLIFGLKSHGMLLAAEDKKGLAILMPDKDIQPGTKAQ